MTSPFTQALDQLEPVARDLKGDADKVMFSIAVSLKRIADLFESVTTPLNPGDQS